MGEEKFELPNKKVKVKFNPYNPGPIKNTRHVAYFKMEGCFDSFGCAMNRNGKLKNPFTDAEKKVLEAKLAQDRGENCLSIYNKEGILYDYDITPIRLSKDPLQLDLNDPYDYVTFKVLLTNSDKICPDYGLLKTSQTYKYYVEDEDQVAEVKAKDSNKSMRTWIAYGEMKEDRNKLIGFLKVYSQFTNKSFMAFNVTTSSKLALIQAKVVDVINENNDVFLKIVENPSYDTILLVAEAVENREIEIRDKKYFHKGGTDKIADTLMGVVDYLNAPINQELKLLLETTIKGK